MSAELLIQNGDTVYFPAVLEDIKWETERYGSPGKLTFKCMYDSKLNVTEGNPVRLRWNGLNVFYGFIFKIEKDKEPVLSITAYDQLRYFKNKDTYVINGKTAGEVLELIAADFELQTGDVEDTGYVIPSLVEDGKSLFDIMQDCLDQTLMNVGEMYVLYDDFGSLSLKNIANLAVNILIDSETGENYKYSSSIDDQTYNKIKLVYDNKNTGQRDVYIAQDSSKMNEWGMLQYYDKLSEGENGKEKVGSLLQLYNRKSKSFQITNAIGDVSVRAGCLLPVILNLGVAKVQSMMLVESCKHVFRENENFMNLTLRGGDFV
jgi:hypothetical protein|nr:hydrolase [Roseburia inulinivorans]DAE65687.1 MAG TPA: 43 kDa tail protein [Caudoviricetes sp.]